MNLKKELIKSLSHKIFARKGILHFEEKETKKTISKEGYMLIYFDLCWVVVHFLGDGGWWCIYLSTLNDIDQDWVFVPSNILLFGVSYFDRTSSTQISNGTIVYIGLLLIEKIVLLGAPLIEKQKTCDY